MGQAPRPDFIVVTLAAGRRPIPLFGLVPLQLVTHVLDQLIQAGDQATREQRMSVLSGRVVNVNVTTYASSLICWMA